MIRLKIFVTAGLAGALLSACVTRPATTPTSTAATCTLSASESAWTARALSAWRLARTEKLRVTEEATPPTMVFFNETCMFTGEGGPPWRGTAHNGLVILPDGNQIPPQVASFASPYADNTHVFFAMALPSIWQAANVQSAEFGLENLTVAVMVHEITHTRQFAAYTPRIDAVAQHYGIPDDEVTDDIVQDTFRENAEYVAAYEAERDLLYRALAASTDAEARGLAGQALTMMRARQARYLVGENEKLLPLEDIFLTMEGVAQWAAYAWIVDERGGGFAPDVGIPGMRRGGRQWSQDEGMVIFLLVDRLVPDWQARAFAAEPETALALLALAAGAPAQ